jgi:flagellin
MQRMRELAVQSANGTYTDEDRQQIQYEVDALKSEVDRISQATEFNEMKLLDGSLAGAGASSGEYGATYGVVGTAGDLKNAIITSSHAGVKVTTTVGASGVGGENAMWSKDGKELTLNLAKNTTYTQGQIDDLIKNASQAKDATATPPELSVKLNNGVLAMGSTATATTDATAAGTRGTKSIDIKTLVGDGTSTTLGSSDTIEFTANSYGDSKNDSSLFGKITIKTDVAAGKEELTTDTNAVIGTSGAEVTLHLATGVDYTEDDIKQILAKGGYDYEVKLTDAATPDGDKDGVVKFGVSGTVAQQTMTEGTGVGKNAVPSTGKGLTFQIGANGVEDQRLTVNVDDMSSSALGISGISVAKQDDANTAINKIDDAIKTVSTQRAKLGAVQNRLEHTVNSLNTANENLTSSESQIRDTDMAAEMIKYTKSNILQQASQSMLAQANQQPQGVLQLLG